MIPKTTNYDERYQTFLTYRYPEMKKAGTFAQTLPSLIPHYLEQKSVQVGYQPGNNFQINQKINFNIMMFLLAHL